ncbi:unnamed protein product [Haemonchus placei]|uniref:Uncharacterized protein n=1 Tax=Haemonchus placei TaxID=6290 RepID=A0A3P7YFB0_HAEPC|nr:unnamed protein product [Haemonchus placei]
MRDSSDPIAITEHYQLTLPIGSQTNSPLTVRGLDGHDERIQQTAMNHSLISEHLERQRCHFQFRQK